MQNKFRFLLLALLALGLFAACQTATSGEGPQVAVDWAATPLSQRTPLPTVTPFVPPTSIPLVTVTVTAVPTTTEPIPTMAPTPVPSGVYVKESDGFTFFYPTEWEILEQTGESLWLRDNDLGTVVSVSSSFKDEESGYDAYLEEFTGDAFRASWELDSVEVTREDELPFAGDHTAQVAWLSGMAVDGRQLDFWLAYAESETRSFFLFAAGEPDSLEGRQASLRQMLAQASLGEIRLFGLDRAKTLVVLGSDPLARSLDPARTTGSAAGYVGMLYSGLVRMSPELQVVPDLAETWQISEDGTVYTFTLREGLTFASGRPLTAADVQASWERAADPDTDSSTVGTYMGDIVGVREKLDGEANEISGVEAVDERTLVVTLDGPKPYFLAKLTYPVSFVLDVDTVDEDDEEWVFEPDASGPFILRDYREDEAIIFASNPAYYTPPLLDAVVYLIGRVGSSISLFEAGEIDIAYLGAVDAEQVRQPSNALHEQWVTTTSMCTTFIQMNNANAPFDDVNVRRAFALAVDKDAYNELVSEGSNLVANTIFPPAMPGYSQETAVAAASYDPEAARAALAESSYADGLPPITIAASGFGDTERDDLNALVENWRDVLGVDVTISFLDPINFSQVVTEEAVQMVSYGWCADYPDPENFVDLLYYTGSEFNVSGYSNAEIDALLEEARVELDPALRLSLYQEIESLLLTDVAAIPLTHGVSDALVNLRVQGFVLTPMGAPVLQLLSFATENGGE
ncbi:MAG: peptide ABC transporter substrate-binding protein [Ardenticatenaceae bacterium]|nr:peptide ABC transporter substrate-binding protein [Ardenticatenaceae bacterium]